LGRLLDGLRPAALCSLGVALPGTPSILIDNRAGMEAAVEHLVRHHGCRRPLFLAGPDKNPDSEERLEAYRSVLRRNGLPVHPELVVCANFLNDQARTAVDDLLTRGVSFDGVVAANDPMAVGAIDTLRRKGRRVPGDIPVTGFDDLLLARLGAPRLTTVAQPFEQLADLAIDTVVAQLSGRSVPDQVVLPTRLVCRQSCGCNEEAPSPRSTVVPRGADKHGESGNDRIASLRRSLRDLGDSHPAEAATTRLLDALVATLSGQPSAFRGEVGRLLDEIGEQDDRHQILQDAITWLRHELDRLGDLDVERAFYDGLSLIALSSFRTQIEQRIGVDDNYFRLRTVGGDTSVAFDLSSLKQALDKSLRAAGIRTIFLSCAPSSTASELVPLVCMVDGNELKPTEERLPARQLLPSLALELDQRRTFLVFPMALGSHLLGVAAIDYLDGIDTFAPFRSEITLVLRSIHLNQDLVRESMLRERSVQERLATTKRMEALSVLAGGVAHDLNNALGPLVVLPEIILDDLGRLPVPAHELVDLKDDVENIRSASLRAAQTIKDLLTLGRQGRTARQNLDLGSVVSACLADSSLRFAGLRVGILADLWPDMLPVMGAESQLARAVTNLIRNAVEATADGGEVTVKTSRVEITSLTGSYENIPPGRYAVLSVADDGCGIRETDLSRLFEPFFTTKPAGERSGSGLGLAIVHGVVKEHQGFIDVKSTPGRGTIFSLHFPLVERQDLTPEPRTPLPRGYAKILVVDDEAVQLRTCQRVLVRLGYQVQTLQSGLAAYELFRTAERTGKSPFDLVILDMVLGEKLDGLQLFEMIQQLFPTQKAIMASGHAPTERAEEAMKKGLPWLTKPYAVDALARIVEHALAGGPRRRPP
jgi:signal transduction histidine kinase/ActR/RegA family two-component response regulator